MKKIVILALVLAFVPLLSFAEFGVGGSAFFNSPVLIGQKLLKILQLDAMALVTLDEVNAIGLYPNAGLAFDLAFLRLSAGIGPTLVFLLDDVTDPTMLGFNAKANADIKLGPVSVGLSYLMGLNFDNGIDLEKSTGMLGANVLFWF
jgi:hypothetical protein